MKKSRIRRQLRLGECRHCRDYAVGRRICPICNREYEWKKGIVFDENGKDAIIYEPFYDARHRKWLGEQPPRNSPDNPPCPTCPSDEASLIHMYPHLDSSNLFHYTVYQCRVCGEVFRV